MLLKCTKKLLTELRVPRSALVLDTEAHGQEPAVFFGNLIRFGRVKCLLFMEPKTLYSIFIWQAMREKTKDLQALFWSEFARTLKDDGFDDHGIQKAVRPGERIQFALTDSRSTLGVMNDVLRCIDVAESFPSEAAYHAWIKETLNNGFRGQPNYVVPVDEMRKVLAMAGR